MREMRFRAWIPLDNIMVYEPIAYINDGEINYALSEGVFTQWDDAKVMQFTWLLDKNGKEIYEGNIVIGIKWDERAPRYEVYFDKEILAYFVRNSKTKFHLCDLWEIEIIWSIYENPELLSN